MLVNFFLMFNIFKNAVIRRIAYVFVVFIFGFISQCAQAANYYNFGSSSITPVQRFPTPEQACAYIASRVNAATGRNYVYQSHTRNDLALTGNCVNFDPTWGTDNRAFDYVLGVTCAEGETYDPATNTCIAPNPCEPNAGKIVAYATNSDAFTQCLNGCEVEREGGTCGYSMTDQYGCNLYGITTANTCEGSITPPESQNTPEYECIKQGKSYGEVNGTIVCVANGTPSTTPVQTYDKKESTTINPDGSTTTTETETTVNPDGSVTTTKVITNTPSGGGTPTTETTQTEDKDIPTFCEENPNSKICDETQSIFAGSCSGNFQCEGDAIQCAIAREQHSRNCALFENETTLSNLGNELVLNGNDGESSHPYNESNRQVIDLETALDNTNPWGTTGLQDLNISVGGNAVTLPLSNLNTTLAWMGYLLIALTSVACYLIIGRG